MKKKWTLAFFVFYTAGALFLYADQDDDPTLRLAIGDPKTKDKTIEVRPGEVVSGRTGRKVSSEAVFKDLRRADFVYVGESHNSLQMHDIQLQVLKELFESPGEKLSVGVEMFPASSQEVLDTWVKGGLSDEDFQREARWYVVWNYHWGFYREIFQFARANAVSVIGLNVAREVISKIRMKGWEGLSEGEKALVPRPDLSNQDHRTLMKAVFSAEEMPHQMKGEGFESVFESLYRAQSAWDEVMAANAIKASEGGKRRVVVLAGSGHLIYNLGINRRVFEKNHRPFRTIICVTVPRGRASVTVSRSLADYVWGLAEEDRPAYPSVGLRLKTFEGLANPVVESKPIDGAALDQDFEQGDVILSVNGQSFSDINELRMFLARFTWGDEATFRLLRAGREKTVVLKFNPPSRDSNSQNRS